MHDALPFLTNNDPEVATGFKALAAFATKIFNHYDQATGDDLATYGKVEKKAGILFENLGFEHRKKLLMIEEKLKNGLEVVKGDFAKPTQMVIQSIKSPEDEATMGPINGKVSAASCIHGVLQASIAHILMLDTAKAADERALEIHYLEVARETSSLRAPGGREIGIDKILGHEKGGRMN